MIRKRRYYYSIHRYPCENCENNELSLRFDLCIDFVIETAAMKQTRNRNCELAITNGSFMTDEEVIEDKIYTYCMIEGIEG